MFWYGIAMAWVGTKGNMVNVLVEMTLDTPGTSIRKAIFASPFLR
jgi:hypothetical protein